MKKFLFVISLVLFGLTACEGPMGPSGPPGRPGQDMIVDNFVVEVRNSNWEHTWVHLGGGIYETFIPIPELTASIFNNGGVVMVFREWWYQGTRFATPLPISIPRIAICEDEFGNEFTCTYTEHYNFEFSAGRLWIYFEVSDFIDGGSPGTQFFRVIIVR